MSSTKFLVDTNVVSELIRPRPHPGVSRWAEQVRHVALSVVTLEELEYGLAWKPKPRISSWLEGFLGSCAILPVTPEIARRAGRLRGALQADGETRMQADMLIAATAQEHGLTLVTRNRKDFVGCGLDLLDPFLDHPSDL
jgi:toxin FitB